MGHPTQGVHAGHLLVLGCACTLHAWRVLVPGMRTHLAEVTHTSQAWAAWARYEARGREQHQVGENVESKEERAFGAPGMEGMHGCCAWLKGGRMLRVHS